MKTGVFFHEVMREASWPIIGNKYRNFPRVLEDVLLSPDVSLIQPEPVSENLLLKVHTRGYLEEVKSRWYYQAACYSIGGCVQAGKLLSSGELTNALVFNVAAGHHASPSSGWGGAYLSCIGPTAAEIREHFGPRKLAIIDTDSHHGDGTRAVFGGDRDVLHVCFCSNSVVEEEGTKIDVNVGWNTTDDEYLDKVWAEFISRVKDFEPFIIFHNFGHDTCQGDYGDRGLTPFFFLRLAEEIRKCADEICGGRYVVVTHGGARGEVAEYIFPRVIKILAGKDAAEVR